MTKAKDQSTRPGMSGTSVTKSGPTSAGNVVWHVKHNDGRIEKLTTTKSSNTAIKEGVSTYKDALRNLAKK